jgi:hypothetical protein
MEEISIVAADGKVRKMESLQAFEPAERQGHPALVWR